MAQRLRYSLFKDGYGNGGRGVDDWINHPIDPLRYSLDC